MESGSVLCHMYWLEGSVLRHTHRDQLHFSKLTDASRKLDSCVTWQSEQTTRRTRLSSRPASVLQSKLCTRITGGWGCGYKTDIDTDGLRAQELCESRGGRPGLPSLISLRFLWTWSNTPTSSSDGLNVTLAVSRKQHYVDLHEFVWLHSCRFISHISQQPAPSALVRSVGYWRLELTMQWSSSAGFEGWASRGIRRELPLFWIHSLIF